jgi:hypothetical protein
MNQGRAAKDVGIDVAAAVDVGVDGVAVMVVAAMVAAGGWRPRVVASVKYVTLS